MVETITLVIILFWLPQAIYQVLNWTYWWQVKEYRFDRFFVFLKTKDGKEKLDLIPIFLKLSILIIAIFKPLFIWLGLFLLILVDLKLFRETAQKSIRKPIVTERVKKILATCLLGIILTLLVYWYFNNIAFSLFIGEVLLLLSPLAGMLWTIPIVNKIKIEEIEKAQKVLKKIKPTVIGITGSTGVIYGVRLLEVLKEKNIETHLIITEWAKKCLAMEEPNFLLLKWVLIEWEK